MNLRFLVKFHHKVLKKFLLAFPQEFLWNFLRYFPRDFFKSSLCSGILLEISSEIPLEIVFNKFLLGLGQKYFQRHFENFRNFFRFFAKFLFEVFFLKISINFRKKIAEVPSQFFSRVPMGFSKKIVSAVPSEICSGIPSQVPARSALNISPRLF